MEVRDGIKSVWSSTSWTGISLQPEVDGFCQAAGRLMAA
jgi:hypothetical protein